MKKNRRQRSEEENYRSVCGYIYIYAHIHILYIFPTTTKASLVAGFITGTLSVCGHRQLLFQFTQQATTLQPHVMWL